jgi:hypothetical protein
MDFGGGIGLVRRRAAKYLAPATSPDQCGDGIAPGDWSAGSGHLPCRAFHREPGLAARGSILGVYIRCGRRRPDCRRIGSYLGLSIGGFIVVATDCVGSIGSLGVPRSCLA